MNERPRVLLAGTTVRALAESAARAGFAVTAIHGSDALDLEGYAEAIPLRAEHGRAYSAELIAQLGARLRAEAVGYGGDLERHPATIETLAEGRQLWGNAPAVLERLRRAESLATLLDAPVPAPALARAGAAGALVFAADGRRAAPLALVRHLPPEGLAAGGTLLGSPTRPIFAAQMRLTDRATALAERLVGELGLVGLNALELVACRGQVHAVSLTPRFAPYMELVERAHGVSMFDLHVRACRGRLPRAELAYRDGSVVYGHFAPLAPEPLVLGDTRRWLRDPALRDLPPPRSRLAAGAPICTVFAEGRDITTCRRALARRAAGLYEDARASRLSAA